MMDLFAWAAKLKLAERFTLARGAEDEAEVVQVELRWRGQSAFGEGAPIARYEESAVDALEFLENSRELLGDDPFALEAINARLAAYPGQHAAKAALDAALHDLCGKLLGVPVWRLLGLQQHGPPTTWTISLGDPDEMARRAERAEGRFTRLKLKLGGLDGLDLQRVQAVRSVTRLPLVVDVNEYWSFEEALDTLPQLASLGVEYCEQPMLAGHLDGPELKKRAPLPIYVDEECHTLEDVEAARERAHGINIKLSKAGGIRESLRMVYAARALGLKVIIGCMNESGLGIAAACQLASLADHADLDGNLLLDSDPWPGVVLDQGVQVPSDRPGLGVVTTGDRVH
jgi:L-alanine-DL-glutamate epimerase-like enolase superfamily enzyme